MQIKLSLLPENEIFSWELFLHLTHTLFWFGRLVWMCLDLRSRSSLSPLPGAPQASTRPAPPVWWTCPGTLELHQGRTDFSVYKWRRESGKKAEVQERRMKGHCDTGPLPVSGPLSIFILIVNLVQKLPYTRWSASLLSTFWTINTLGA